MSAQDVGIIGLFSDWPATTTLFLTLDLFGPLDGRRATINTKKD